MTKGFHAVRKRIYRNILAVWGPQFLNHAISVLFLFLQYLFPTVQHLDNAFLITDPLHGGSELDRTPCDSEQENVSCWWIFLGQYHPHVPVLTGEWKLTGKQRAGTSLSPFFPHMDGGRAWPHCFSSFFGSQLHLNSNYSPYAAASKIQISAIRRVHFCRFKPKTCPTNSIPTAEPLGYASPWPLCPVCDLLLQIQQECCLSHQLLAAGQGFEVQNQQTKAKLASHLLQLLRSQLKALMERSTRFHDSYIWKFPLQNHW